MATPSITERAVIKYLGAARFESLGKGRFDALQDVIKRAPDVPTAGVWTLQLCQILPTEADLSKWASAVASLRKP